MFQSDKELSVEKIVELHPCLDKWRKRIEKASKRGYFSLEDAKLSMDWDYCAVGEAAKQGWNIKNQATGGSKDHLLIDLGVSFFCNVSSCRKTPIAGSTNFDNALEIISKIEDRLITLGKE